MTGKVLRALLGTVYTVALMAASGIAAELISRAAGWKQPHSLGAAAIFGVFIGAGTLLMVQAQQRGWIQPGLFSPRPELEKRKAELAAERDRLLADAKAKARAAAGTRGGSEPRLN